MNGRQPIDRTKPAGLLRLLERSAELLEQDAASIRESHTVGGRWPSPDDLGVRLDYQELRFLAKQLRSAHSYHKRNPLGGPAKMFDAIADRIRAGESVQSCMADYGIKWEVENVDHDSKPLLRDVGRAVEPGP